MRFANQRLSPSKSQKQTNTGSITSPNNARIQSQKMYVHYNNAIYMGGMTSYKKNGNGIMLIDEGTSMITQYCFDNMVGHNIIFRDNCIMSVLILKNNVTEIAIRTGQCLIKLPFMDKENIPSGNGVLIDYQSLKIYHILFQNGRIVKKVVQSNKKIIKMVQNQQLNGLFDKRHQSAFKMNLKTGNGLKMMKQSKKIIVGYVDHRFNLEGLGFKLKIDQQNYDNLSHPLELKCMERGFYKCSRLWNFGERAFSNGNSYIGEFNDDQFNGQGILLYPNQEKWVFGLFEDDKLKKMLRTNIEKVDAKQATIRSCLKEIHEYNMKNWISDEVYVFSWEHLKKICYEVFASKTTDVVIEKQKVLREEQKRLQMIFHHFNTEEQSAKIDKIVEEQAFRNKIHPQKLLLSEFSSSKLKIVEIQPRSIENKLYWTTEDHSMQPNNRYSFENKSPQTAKKMQKNGLSPLKTRTNSTKKDAVRSPLKRYNYNIAP